jgi:PAS domain S-box-containing protein
VFIVRGGKLLHANQRALSLLGFSSLADLEERRDIAALLEAAGPSLTVTGATGAAVGLTIAKSEIPWFSGPATQVKAAIAAPDAPALEVAPAAPPEVPPAPSPEPARLPKHEAPRAPAAGTEESWRPDNQELRAILDTASDGIIMLDGEGTIRSFSAGAEALFGKPKAEVVGERFEVLLTPETRKTFRDYLSALADSGLASIFNDGREVEAIAGPGRSLPLFLTMTRLHAGSKGSRTEQPFCAVVRDITQWKKTEAELRQAKDEAERTSAQKSEFLARISHELRTPLNAILGFSEVMRLERFGRIQNDKYRSYVDDIHTSGGHLLSLINDLLDLSKVEAGRLELNFTSVDLAEVTDHAVRALAEQAQRARVALRKNLPADLPSVVADQRSMRQIMLNLLSNAVKFTDPGGQVTVSASLTKAGELVLRVKDTGIGMNEQELKDALEPFRRVTSDARGNIEGTGLGLPLTKALAEANRAAFSISSEPGKGTVVEITYPTTRVLAD